HHENWHGGVSPPSLTTSHTVDGKCSLSTRSSTTEPTARMPSGPSLRASKYIVSARQRCCSSIGSAGSFSADDIEAPKAAASSAAVPEVNTRDVRARFVGLAPRLLGMTLPRQSLGPKLRSRQPSVCDRRLDRGGPRKSRTSSWCFGRRPGRADTILPGARVFEGDGHEVPGRPDGAVDIGPAGHRD